MKHKSSTRVCTSHTINNTARTEIACTRDGMRRAVQTDSRKPSGSNTSNVKGENKEPLLAAAKMIRQSEWRPDIRFSVNSKGKRKKVKKAS